MKSRLLMTAASVIALGLAAPAAAAGASDRMKPEAQTKPDTPPGAATTPAGARGTNGGSTAGVAQPPMASDLLGNEVQGSNGDDIGDVKGVITDAGGKVRGVVLDVGGFLGIGQRPVAIGWDKVTQADKGKIRVNMTSEQLEKLPKYEMTDQQKHEGVFQDTAATF